MSTKHDEYVEMSFWALSTVRPLLPLHRPHIVAYSRSAPLLLSPLCAPCYAAMPPYIVHNQGIIHRDIKPANLLWSADRRIVKIADFGVSHFSYAQRLAAASARLLAGEDGTGGGDSSTADSLDPILMDESDLSKFAGTPMFLAPEIVADSTTEYSSTTSVNALMSPSPSSGGSPSPPSQEFSSPGLLQSPLSSTPTTSFSSGNTPTHLSVVRRKPPITKSIDIWAFGVTLYGLLFGTLPFRGETEYQIYTVIRTEDWDVPRLMGSDNILVGGRRQKNSHATGVRPSGSGGVEEGMQDEAEGFLVVSLLEGLLQKDANKRYTLDDIKVSGSFAFFS